MSLFTEINTHRTSPISERHQPVVESYTLSSSEFVKTRGTDSPVETGAFPCLSPLIIIM